MILTVCSIEELFHCSISKDCLTFARQHLPQTQKEPLSPAERPNDLTKAAIMDGYVTPRKQTHILRK